MSSRDENATDDSAAAAAAAVQTEGMQDGDESGSGEDGEDDDDEVLEPKVLPQRTTRGTRVTSMSGEGDDDFWQQEFFAEEAEADVDYSSSDAEQDDEPDEVDSDFDADEDDDEDDGSEVQADKEATMKKKGAYVDPKQQAAKRAAAAKKAAATKARKAAAAVPQKLGTGEPPSIEYDDDGFPTGTVTLGTGPYAGQGVAAPAADDSSASSKKRSSLPMSVQLAMLPGRKSVRKATVDSTLQTAKKEAADSSRRAKLAAQAKPKVVYRLKTQEEQLADCAATERENIASLEYLQRVEEEKKKELAPKPKPIGPRVRLESKRVPGTDRAEVRLTFTNGQLPEIFSSPALDPAVAAAAAAASPSSSPASSAAATGSAKGLPCVVTGLPARYLDPRTQLPYANAAAFAALRAKSPVQVAQLQAALAQRMGTVASGAGTGSRRALAPAPPSAAAAAAGVGASEAVQGAIPSAAPATAAAAAAGVVPASAKKRKIDEVKSSPPPAAGGAPVASAAATPLPTIGDAGAEGPNTPAKKKARVSKAPAKKK